MNQIDCGSVFIGIVEVRALNAAEPVQAVRVAGPDE